MASILPSIFSIIIYFNKKYIKFIHEINISIIHFPIASEERIASYELNSLIASIIISFKIFTESQNKKWIVLKWTVKNKLQGEIKILSDLLYLQTSRISFGKQRGSRAYSTYFRHFLCLYGHILTDQLLILLIPIEIVRKSRRMSGEKAH